FSSRTRHTSFSRDWSPDVCSSDLRMRNHQVAAGRTPRARPLSDLVGQDRIDLVVDRVTGIDPVARQVELAGRAEPLGYDTLVYEIGRASCRERGESSEVGVAR